MTITIGSGPPLVLIPGIQGRWEWMRHAIEALGRDWQVVTFSLPGEPDSGTEASGDFDTLIQHVDRALDEAGIRSAVICGVSFGGLIALRYAACRRDRVRALILVSAPGPRWTLKPELARYLRWPTLSYPLFLAGSLGRFWPELRATYPDMRNRLRFCAATLSTVFAAPAAPSRMSHRARLLSKENFETDCSRIAVPTLVIAGERGLDHVVEYDDTLNYVTLISGACFQSLEHTGHLGIVSAPERFAAIVSRFARMTWPTTSA